jgi:hypothetical protein
VTYWINLTFACCGVVVEDGIVVEAAPVLSRFVGQPFVNLMMWREVIEVRGPLDTRIST